MSKPSLTPIQDQAEQAIAIVFDNMRKAQQIAPEEADFHKAQAEIMAISLRLSAKRMDEGHTNPERRADLGAKLAVAAICGAGVELREEALWRALAYLTVPELAQPKTESKPFAVKASKVHRA